MAHYNQVQHQRRFAPGKVGAASILGLASFCLCLLLFYVGFADWLFARSLTIVAPGQFMLLVVGLASAASGVALFQSYRPHPLIILIPAAYAAIVLIASVIHAQDDALALVRVAYMAGLTSLIIAVMQVPPRWIYKAMFVGLITLCVINLVDYFLGRYLPIPMSEIPGRAAGFHINPNVSAMLIGLTLPPIACALPARLRALLYLVTFAATLLTFSRGGALLWLTAVTLTEAFVLRPGAVSAKLLVLAAIGISVAVILIVFGNDIAGALILMLGSYLSPDLTSRLYLDVNDFAANERKYAAAYAWQLFTTYPDFGSGIGLLGRWTFSEMSHNMILQTLAEFGVPGALWLLAFFAMLWRGIGRLGGVMLALWLLASAFSHNMFDHLSTAAVISVFAVAGRKIVSE